MLVEVGEEQKDPRQSLFAAVEELSDEGPSMRMFLASMCDRNQSERPTPSCSRRRISAVLTIAMVLAVTVSAVHLRRRCPARAPSPKNSPAWMMPTTASRPARDVTVNFTRPFRMYITAAHRSPCAKTVSHGL
jgi:hypothetical protein